MRTHSWSKQGPRILFAAASLLLAGCSSGGDPSDPNKNTGGSSTSSSGASAQAAGAGGAKATGGSGAVSSGGTNSVSGSGSGAASGVGGSVGVGGAISSMGGSMTDACASVTCATGQTCSNGTCMCTTGMACSDGCFNTQDDQNHCGNCTTKCAADGACVSGVCVNPTCKSDTEVRNGRITNYSLATSMVACHYPTNTLPMHYGAMNQYDWNESGVCGACVEITSGGKKLVVTITDECPDVEPNKQWCFKGSHHIDLNKGAKDVLDPGTTNPSVTWKYVNCTPTGNIKYYFDQGTKQYYLAVTPMNVRNVVAKMEVQVGGKWTPMPHTAHNTYVLDGIDYGTAPLNFRTTDIYNHVIVETLAPAANKVVDGTKQFAACP
jgi:expansin